MDPLQELLDWATSHGVRLNGIAPERIPGRGIGVLAMRDIEADEIVLDVPTSCLRTLSTVPKARLRKLGEASGSISVHGLLAADLALDTSGKFAPWDAIVPRPADLAGMPLNWQPELQALLPLRAAELIAVQKSKFMRDWEAVAAVFPELSRGKRKGQGKGKGMEGREGKGEVDGEESERYKHAWLLVNSRTFYYLDAALKRRRGATRDDYMALQPVADLFNHTDEGGCHVAFGGDGFAFRTTVPYRKGDEVRICYGHHGGDFLLAEYGFVMDGNCWDEVLIDEVVLRRLDDSRKERLRDAGFLGRYTLDRETICHRTEVALRLLCCKVGEWMRFVNGSDDGEGSQGAVDTLLLELLKEYATVIKDTMGRIRALEIGNQSQVDLLMERWEQIRRLVGTRIASLEGDVAT